MKPFNCASLLVILALLLSATGCGAQPAPVQPTAGGGPQLNAPPGETALDPDQKPGQGVVADDEGENEEILIPTNPNAHPERVVPGKESAFSAAQPGGLGPQAAGTFTVYRNSSLLAADFPNTWHVAEPSVAPDGRVIFTSGNKYDGVSGDYGLNFTYIDPFTIWPPPPPSSQFCCDQIALHDRTHNMTLWLEQYHTQVATVSGPNVIRLNVAHGQKETMDGSWLHYDIQPQNLPEFSGSNNWWWDYPDMALSNNYLYITINPNIHIDSGQQRAVIFRLSLDTLAAGGSLGMPWPYYVTPTDVQGFARPTQGATTTMYFGQHVDNATLRVYTWPELMPGPLYTDITVNGWYNGDSYANSPDGTNWLGYNLKPVQTGWVSKGLIGFMWNSAQGGSFPYPQVRWVRIKESDLTLNDQGNIWSSSFAWGFPSASVNDRGDVGGTIGVGGGVGATIAYPQMQAWIADSFNGNAIQPLENVTVATGTNGSGTRWGDYYNTRRDSPYGNTWIGTGIVMNGGSDDGHTNVHLVWFGRGQDTPPANNTIYGDAANATLYQDGTSAHSYRKAGDSCYAAIPGDTVILKAGTYNEPGLTITRPCFIDSTGGSAVIH